jgi:hypothetical protein
VGVRKVRGKSERVWWVFAPRHRLNMAKYGKIRNKGVKRVER